MVESQDGNPISRYPANPIVRARDIPYPCNAVFNAGVTTRGAETLLLLRIEDRRGISHFTVARSRDGVSDWRVGPAPNLVPDSSRRPEELWGIEDPRITRLEDLDGWAVVYTAYSRGGPLVALATTRDFEVYDHHGVVMPPEDKDAALFPVRFDGRWAMLHRPVSTSADAGAHIWLSFSPDLKHWGDHRIVLPARRGAWWDANKVGLGPPPLRTEEGWLILYHGVKTTASGAIYRLGLALLGLEDPSRLIARSDEWVMTPEEPYERSGDVDKVIFPCGWIADGDELRIYYGAADTSIALATASITGLLGWLDAHGSRHTST